jgi:hypothetical protein
MKDCLKGRPASALLHNPFQDQMPLQACQQGAFIIKVCLHRMLTPHIEEIHSLLRNEFYSVKRLQLFVVRFYLVEKKEVIDVYKRPHPPMNFFKGAGKIKIMHSEIAGLVSKEDVMLSYDH